MTLASTPVFSLAAGRARPSETRLATAIDGGHKVPPLIALFWVIKIAATTLGETGGDAVSMSLHLGYLASSAIFLAILAVLVTRQVRSAKLHPALYWAVIVATTTAGTTIADFCDRSLGIGYAGGVMLLSGCVAVVLLAWRMTLGAVASDRIVARPQEMFYWAAILASNTLGTALGDWAADTGGLGYGGGAALFGAALAAIAVLYGATAISRVLLFWAAFVLTRPLGATLGDLLTKPRIHGGLDLNRFAASSLIAAAMIGCILLYPRQSEGPGQGA